MDKNSSWVHRWFWCSLRCEQSARKASPALYSWLYWWAETSSPEQVSDSACSKRKIARHTEAPELSQENERRGTQTELDRGTQRNRPEGEEHPSTHTLNTDSNMYAQYMYLRLCALTAHILGYVFNYSTFLCPLLHLLRFVTSSWLLIPHSFQLHTSLSNSVFLWSKFAQFLF